MKGVDRVKVTLYVFMVMTLIHIVISIITPAWRFNSGFSFSSLPASVSNDAADEAAFASPVHVTDRRVGAPETMKFFSFFDGPAIEALSPWYDVNGGSYIMLGGFPFLEGNSLQIEAQATDGQPMRIELTDRVNPQGVMAMRKIRLNAGQGLHKVRIAARQGAKGTNTWFAVSEPFIITGKTRELMAVLRIFFSVAAAVTLLLGPGLALRILLSKDSVFRAAAFIVVPGIIMSAICGLICWLAAPYINTQLIAIAFALINLFLCIYCLNLRSAHELVSNIEWKALCIVFIVVLMAVGKAGYSVGPFEELHGGTISRTLDAGGRPDSRIQYHVVQLVANGLSPYSEAGKRFFYPWSFASRTPVGGLAAATLVLLAGGRPPVNKPMQAWSPFDNEGFAVYRAAMIVMSAACLLALFSVVSLIAGQKAGYFSVLLLSLTPFFVHEVYYSWPKLSTAGFVLMALYTVLARRPRQSGLFLGLGYLCHPMALLSLPVIIFVLIAASAGGSKNYKKVFADSGIIAITFLMFPLLWMVVNGSAERQAYFTQYVLMVDGKQGASLCAWLTSRLKSLANTAIPLYLYFFTGSVKEVNSLHGLTPRIIPFMFQYWNTVPFGFGISALILLIKKTYQGAQLYPIVFTAALAAPFFGFAVYWGYNVTGLMPEGLHVWVLSVLIFIVWTWRPLSITKTQAVVLSLRGVEVLIMLIAPVWLSVEKRLDEVYYVNDIVMLCVMFGAAAILVKKTLGLSSL
ncbi:MAG: glycosyltransferase family 39 protein [Candidatus Magnetominusculus sp. LBB02]|nr:glycosyltransferase family 39 protein [Candidatus Magnetominusculus sp. LBB02]